MPISRSHWMSSLLSVILDWRHWSGRHQYLSWHWPCHWLREPRQLAFWVCPVVEATKSRQTIFDFVLESPSSQFITTVNLALLSITAFNPASLDHDYSLGWSSAWSLLIILLRRSPIALLHQPLIWSVTLVFAFRRRPTILVVSPSPTFRSESSWNLFKKSWSISSQKLS